MRKNRERHSRCILWNQKHTNGNDKKKMNNQKIGHTKVKLLTEKEKCIEDLNGKEINQPAAREAPDQEWYSQMSHLTTVKL